MNQKLTRWLAVASLAVAVACPLVTLKARAQDGAVSSIEQLKTDAFKAVRTGHFDAGNDLLGKAADQSHDPTLTQMHGWTAQFEDQLKVFAGERRQAYDKAVDNVKLLVKNGFEDYALDFANRAQSLSDDQKDFHTLPWVSSLVEDAKRHAGEYEAAGQWQKAMRVYVDLVAVEPASRDWKEKLKLATRRVRLLVTYAPDVIEAATERDAKDRDAVNALLAPPTTRPTTKPVSEPLKNNAFRIDWHDTLRGIELPMLVTAMQKANNEYYRDVDYRGLLAGGLMGVDTVVNTPGLEKTFPSLSDPAAKAEFQKYLDHWKAEVKTADSGEAAHEMIDTVLSDGKDGLLAVNAQTLKLPDEVLISEFADGAFAGLDPFTSMIWPSELAEFRKATQGTFSGIGIQIHVEENGDLKVVSPLPDSPAIRAGIRADDVIAGIDGKSAKNITDDQAVKSITGPVGSTVHLSVRSPDATTHEYDLRRQTIKVASVKGYVQKPDQSWDYYIDPANKIAYLRIGSFTETTVPELHAVLDNLGDDVNGAIIDLRGNPGGLLTAATGVCDTFLKDGVIVSTHPDRDTPNPATEARAHDDGKEFTKPLVVLINQYSASASEIVSGALKDDHRAILVGERSYGKGSVQQLFRLEQATALLKLTTAHYYLPSGRCIHREENSTEWGVDPDVRVEMTPEQVRAMMDARLDMDILRDAHAPAAEGQDAKLRDVAPAVNAVGPGATTRASAATTNPADAQANPNNPLGTKATPRKGLLETDPQLSAALLVLRLELAGSH